MHAASAIGLTLTMGELTGTIDQELVLGALAGLAGLDPENEDLFRDATARVKGARSAGAEELHAGSRLSGSRDGTRTQLRYRAEMTDLFTDLAIDVGLRRQEKLVSSA